MQEWEVWTKAGMALDGSKQSISTKVQVCGG